MSKGLVVPSSTGSRYEYTVLSVLTPTPFPSLIPLIACVLMCVSQGHRDTYQESRGGNNVLIDYMDDSKTVVSKVRISCHD